LPQNGAITKAGRKLTANQRKAAELFATNDTHQYTVEEIGKQCGVNRRTVQRWKKKSEFIDYQNAIADKAMEDFLAETYTTLKGIVRLGKSDHAKLKAIELVLKNRGRLTDVQKLEATVEDKRSEEAIDKEIEELERLLADMDSEDQQEKAE